MHRRARPDYGRFGRTTAQPAPVRADSDLLRQLVRLLDTGSVTISPGQAMGFGCLCPPSICL
jgi:hypothetical protein